MIDGFDEFSYFFVCVSVSDVFGAMASYPLDGKLLNACRIHHRDKGVPCVVHGVVKSQFVHHNPPDVFSEAGIVIDFASRWFDKIGVSFAHSFCYERENFIMNGYWILSNSFFCICVYDHAIFTLGC